MTAGLYDDDEPGLYHVGVPAPGPAGRLPLTPDLLQRPSGDLSGWTCRCRWPPFWGSDDAGLRGTPAVRFALAIVLFATAACGDRANGADAGAGSGSTVGTASGSTSGGSGAFGTGTASGSGSGASSGNGLPEHAAACDAYCTAITANCTGPNAQYTSKSNCMTACFFIPVTDPLGQSNTVACRAGIASMAGTAPDRNCRFAGAETFGYCGDECEAFCILTTGYCPGVYASMTDCVAACQNFNRVVDNTTPGGSFSVTETVTGDTLECRFSDLVAHAMASAANQVADCPHAAVMSSVCTGSPPRPPMQDASAIVASDGGT